MTDSIIETFNDSVFSFLQKHCVHGHLLVGVSGGADSVALLKALYDIREKTDITLTAVTVDHNIRPPEQSSADCCFVERLCASLDGLPCIRHTIEKGAVASLAAERGKGIEDAARKLRYDIFEKCAAETGASYVCLAHHQDDNIETILQRFFQGSVHSSASISEVRGIFIRPLLSVSRTCIEQYLRSAGLEYCTDATNADESYFRNKLRLNVIPYLDSVIPGWKTAVLKGAQKTAFDRQALDNLADGSQWHSNKSGGSGNEALCIDDDYFYGQPFAVRIRLLYNALKMMKTADRIPYSILETAAGENFVHPCESCGIRFYRLNGKLFVSSAARKRTNTAFFAIIEELCTYTYDGWIITAAPEGSAPRGCTALRTSLPCAVVKNEHGRFSAEYIDENTQVSVAKRTCDVIIRKYNEQI